ncbi:unnamed protein product [Chilo suppressalis]|uniref:Uncharacterized protein n=1 Tax=Chilo suppressalis TaxID=168631 RepID=A0ABN8BCB9_CHISP|nr:unnamed protein product [Chilo suppressalis]
MGKKKKPKLDGNPVPSESDSDENETDKYKPYKIENYCRQYPEDGGNFEYLVIYESTTESKPIGDRDLMSLGTVLKRHNKGIKRLKRINGYKVAAIIERPGLANMALNNTKSLSELQIKCNIPATLTDRPLFPPRFTGTPLRSITKSIVPVRSPNDNQLNYYQKTYILNSNKFSYYTKFITDYNPNMREAILLSPKNLAFRLQHA